MRLMLVVVIAAVGCASDGSMGEQGIQGLRGPAGPAGQRGPEGAVGPSGPEGATGARGPMGVQGAPGKDAAGGGYRPSFWVACSRALDIVIGDGSQGTDGISETWLSYSWILFSNHDVETSCTATLGSAQSAAGGGYFPSTRSGAANGACIASADYPPITSGSQAGYWYFTTTTSGPQAQYKDDGGHWLNGHVVMFVENDCSVEQMDASGAWNDAALSDVF